MNTRYSRDEIIGVMREEWEKKIKLITEEIELSSKTKIGDKQVNLIDQGLKVRHAKSGIRYTVSSAGPQDVILVTPEGEEMMINSQELEKDYELD